MLLQAPLFPISKFVEKYFGPRLGNVFVWMSLILGLPHQLIIDNPDCFLGQPLAVMMYYHDYVVDHFGEEEITAFADLQSFQNMSVKA